MFQTWLERIALVVAVTLAPAALLHAALPNFADAPGRGSLAGQLLVAMPTMSDPRFHQAVILMVRHDPSGAFGVVINRPGRELSLASLLAAAGGGDGAAEGRVRIYAGGPVQLDVGFVLHSTEYKLPETLQIDGQIALTATREILRDIAKKEGPRQSLIAFGYAGWGPGQLEGELGLRVWSTAAANPTLVFELDRDKVWEEATKRRTQDL